MSIPMTPVNSSNIDSWGYDAARAVLAVKFKPSGEVWHYEAVPASTAVGMGAAVSVGAFFAAFVKKRHVGRKQ